MTNKELAVWFEEIESFFNTIRINSNNVLSTLYYNRDKLLHGNTSLELLQESMDESEYFLDEIKFLMRGVERQLDSMYCHIDDAKKADLT